MAVSTAISAQGSTLQVSTGTGGAKTITAAAIGFPTIFTSSAHGLANGDVVAIADLVGTISAMNGASYTVKNVTTNTFAVEYDSTGKTYTSGGTATPQTYTKVGNLKDFSGFDGKAVEIDVTHLESTAKEFRLGLVDNGQIQFNVDSDQNDAGQLALQAALIGATQKSFKLTLPNSKVASFSGYVTQFSISGSVDGVVKTPCTVRITGAVTWA